MKDKYAIFRDSKHGPTFGRSDMGIAYSKDSMIVSSSNLGYTYKAPAGYVYKANSTNSLLGGSEYFTPSEVEVLYLI